MCRLSKMNRSWQISKLYVWESREWTGNEWILMREWKEIHHELQTSVVLKEQFPMAPGQTWKAHILRGIVWAGFPMAAWAFIAAFMKGFKSFHFWEAGSVIRGFLQTLNYILRQNDLGSWSAVPRAGKWVLVIINEPLASCLISATLLLGKHGSSFLPHQFSQMTL